MALALNHAEIEQLHRLYIPRLLPRLGYQSSFPRAVIFAPKTLGGIGLVPLNTIITQRKITFMLRQLRANTDLGRVLLINLRWAQVQAGCREPIFTSNKNIDYIENAWAIQLHKALSDMEGKLLIHQFLLIILLRIIKNTTFVCIVCMLP